MPWRDHLPTDKIVQVITWNKSAVGDIFALYSPHEV
jgi:hypothetical protein